MDQPLPTRIVPARRTLMWRILEWLLVLCTLAGLVATIGYGILLLGNQVFAERIYPNISVHGLPIGGMTRAEARAALQRRYADFLAAPVTLSFDGQLWLPAAEDLGLRLAIDEALDTAFALGHQPDWEANLRLAAATWQHGIDLPLHLQFDQRVAQITLRAIAAEIDRAPIDASVELRNNIIIVGTEQWGRQTLIDETIADIAAAVQSLQPQEVPIRTRQLEPRVRDTDLAPTVTELRLLLSGPIWLEGRGGQCPNGCRWEWPTTQIATWIKLRNLTAVDGRPAMAVMVDQTAIRAALTPIAAALREEGSLPRVDWNNGNPRIRTPGTPGRGLAVEEALARINGALYGNERTVLLPMRELPPPVNPDNLAALGLSEPVGIGVSSFRNSAEYRITNILAGARQIDGILIPPGATFSFNTTLGPVIPERGFVEGLAIVDNRTQKEWGGGLCQVSTTVFRAAFFAGLPISERHAHSFRISWYEELGEPPGLDAAIFTGVHDLRFVNDTGGWLLLTSKVDLHRQQLTIILYGPPSNRRVEYSYRILERTPAPTQPLYVDDPSLPSGVIRQTDTARDGLRVEIYRTVYTNGEVSLRDTIPTTFQPWPNIFVRGTGR
ncbi:VanW family protein [Chloroflexus sp.]|uniref:VanW family protein n=1 Tax=Chloroflexus sp. TaxID=1904827 RepID=UPI003D1032E9